MKKSVKILLAGLLLAAIFSLASCAGIFQGMSMSDETFSAYISGREVEFYFSDETDASGYWVLEVTVDGERETAHRWNWYMDLAGEDDEVKDVWIYKELPDDWSDSTSYRIGTFKPDDLTPDRLTAYGNFSAFIEGVHITDGTVFHRQ